LKDGISIVIPNFNGRLLMERHLPSVEKAMEAVPQAELIVVDDGSTDDSAAWLKSRGGIRLLTHEKNRGFAPACTSGIEAAAFDTLVLLNTDVEVRPDFLPPLIESLAPSEVFAVGCMALNEDGVTLGENLKIPHLKQGKLKFRKLRNMDLEGARACLPRALPTLFATGGFMAMKKALFLALGGFDPLFEPFYFEDADLCYRAWKGGNKVLLEPRSVVIHRHEGAILAHHGKKRARRIQERNRMLLLWKNLTHAGLFYRGHLAPLVLRLAFKWLVLDFDFYAAFFGAMTRRPMALAGRAREKAQARRRDDEVFREIQAAAPMDGALS
jgi:GT2 family glycosyltransferase